MPELGGKSPHIVFEDVNIDRAIPIIVRGIVQNAGQTCTAGSRLLVQESIFDNFVAPVGELFAGVRVGTADMDLDCGPVMNASQKARMNRYIDEAQSAGIPVIAKGKLEPDLPRGGYFVQPVLFGPVRTAKLACEEVFGPVLAAMSFKDEREAIALANGTSYGLLAAVWTENGGRQQRVARLCGPGRSSSTRMVRVARSGIAFRRYEAEWPRPGKGPAGP